MKNNPLVLVMICAVSWSIWPALAKKSGMPSGLFTIIIYFLSASVVILYLTNYTTVSFELKKFSTGAIVLIVISGLLNGIGAIAYGRLFDASSNFDISKYVPLCCALIPAIAVISSVIILKEPLSLHRAIGLVIIMIGIYFINK